MAIIEELGLRATVVINNEVAPEYPDTESFIPEEFGPNTKKIHRFVRCVEGAEFAINVDAISSSSEIQQWLAYKDHAIAFDVLIDGGRLDAATFVTRERQSTTISGVTDATNDLLRKFCFTAISTVDDSSKSRVAKDIELVKNLGEIRVCVYRVVLTTFSKPISIKQCPLEASIAEKALKGKAISHGATLNTAVHTAPQLVRDRFDIDLRHAPLAAFYFKYRSTEDLQKEMIIPRLRVPSPEAEVGKDDDFDDLPKEDIERLARERHAELKKRKRSATFKREEDDSVARPERSYKYTQTSDGKRAIDLTQDDDK